MSTLLAAALAYGRADLFRPTVDALLKRMGPSPAAFVRALDVAGARELLVGFIYPASLMWTGAQQKRCANVGHRHRVTNWLSRNDARLLARW